MSRIGAGVVVGLLLATLTLPAGALVLCRGCRHCPPGVEYCEEGEGGDVHALCMEMGCVESFRLSVRCRTVPDCPKPPDACPEDDEYCQEIRGD